MSIVTGFNTEIHGTILDIGQVFESKTSGSAITTNMTAKNGLGDIGNLFQAYSPYLTTPLFNSIYTVTILGVKYDLSQIFKCYPIIPISSTIFDANYNILSSPQSSSTNTLTIIYNPINLTYSSSSFIFMYSNTISGYLVGGGGGGAGGSFTSAGDEKGGGGGGGGEVYNINDTMSNINNILINTGIGGNLHAISPSPINANSTSMNINTILYGSAYGGITATNINGQSGGNVNTPITGGAGGAGGASAGANGSNGISGTISINSYGGGGGGGGATKTSNASGGGGGGGIVVNTTTHIITTGAGGNGGTSTGNSGGINNGGSGGNQNNPGIAGINGGGGGGGGSSTNIGTQYLGGVGGNGCAYLSITFTIPP
jgi:hypothetical protein